MQTLQVTKNSFESIGYGRKLEPFNFVIRKNLILFTPGLTFLWIYFINEASSPQEYMESFYVVVACSCIAFCAVHTIFDINKLTTFFDILDELVNESK